MVPSKLSACIAAMILVSACDRPATDTPTPPPAPTPDLAEPAAPVPAAENGPAGVPPLSQASYQMQDIMDLGLTGEESMRDIAHILQVKHGAADPAEGDYAETIFITEDGANVTIVFTADGIPDDSVKAEQYVVEAFLPAANWTPVTGYGVRYKCWRGDAQDMWTNKPCP